MAKLIIHDFISNTLDLLVVVSKPKIVRKHYCYRMASIALSVVGCIDYLAYYGAIFTRAVFPAKKPKMFAGRR